MSVCSRSTSQGSYIWLDLAYFHLQDLHPAQQPQPSAQGVKGRITIVCIADSLDREKLQDKLRDRGQRFLTQSHADVLYGQHCLLLQDSLCGIMYVRTKVYDSFANNLLLECIGRSNVALWLAPKPVHIQSLTHKSPLLALMPKNNNDGIN